MATQLQLLMAEDSEDDAELLLLALRGGGYEVVSERVETAADLRAALARQSWDIITSDNAMPRLNATDAVKIARGLCPETPFIIVSGDIDLGLAIALMKSGAVDYIQKNELPRIVPVIGRVLEEVKIRRERQRASDASAASESRYRRLFETAQDGILILNADSGEIEDVNPFLISMLGYSKEQFLGRKLWEIGAFIDTAASKAAFLELQTRGYVRYEDLPLETSDGRHIAVEFVSNVYWVEAVRVAQCNIRDVTINQAAAAEIRKLNVELEQRVAERTSQLEALNNELEAFNYSVSHDLRAPLRRILGFADALRDTADGGQSASSLQLIGNIRNSVTRMSELIDALLKLARFSRTPLLRKAVDVSAVVRGIAAELRQIDEARVIEFVVPDNVTAYADEPLLLIVLENLLGNAWKFTAACASARVEFGVLAGVEGTPAYFVRDNGAGFDMAYAGKLFAPFQRLHSEKEFPGIGIGLATVQRIINRHGGRVWAESALGAGATFSFTLSESTA